MQKNYKILISCYACSPSQGSEPGMGWNFIIHLARYHKLYIIVEKEKWEEELTTYFQKNLEFKKNVNFYFISKKRNKLLRKIWPPSYYWFYQNWQKTAYRLAKKLMEEHDFDIVHQLNMVGYREPGYLWKLKKTFVWGPVGGLNISPWRMLPSMGIYGGLYYFGRNVLNLLQMHFNRRVKHCVSASDAIIAATMDNHHAIKKLWRKNSVIIPEVGLSTNNKPDFHKCSDTLKICWVGQHTPRKSLNLLIDALPLVIHKKNIELNVIGDGTRTKIWKKRALKLGVNNLIKWHGWITKDETESLMRSCDLFCITSLSDLTSTVLLEALSSGLPVIALDHCGFSNVITDKCGFKIAINTPRQVVRDIAMKIDYVFENEKIRQSMSKFAYERAKEFNWIDKIDTINQIYNKLLETK